MKAIQLNAIIIATKKIFGYIILIGFGVLFMCLLIISEQNDSSISDL
jgi:hypothetical protein